jgi:trehalose/maltose hydrolase-like predicted phosphorylase
MGSVWQALAFGFAWLRARSGELFVSPQLPSGWRSLAIRVQIRGCPVRLRVSPARLEIAAARRLTVRVGAGGQRVRVGAGGIRLRQTGDGAFEEER